MKKYYPLRSLAFIALIAGIVLPSFGGPGHDGQPGTKDIQAPTLSFTVRTVEVSGPYSPKHVLAIWVEDSVGTFVKTRKLRANSRKQHLVRWVASSNNNVVDAITGSTINSHTTHTVSWDCKDVSGNVVPDGNYTMNVEFTSRNSANSGQADGPTTSIPFTKSGVSQSLAPPDETYFKDMSLIFDPGSGVGIEDIINESEQVYKAFPNPFAENLNISCEFGENTRFELSVYSLNGILIEKIFEGNLGAGQHMFQWNSSSFPAGIYLLKTEANGISDGWSVVKSGR